MALIEIDQFYDQAAGQVAAGALRAAGIAAVLMGDQLGALSPLAVNWQGGLRLCVPAEDLAEAEAILQASTSGPAPTSDSREVPASMFMAVIESFGDLGLMIFRIVVFLVALIAAVAIVFLVLAVLVGGFEFLNGGFRRCC